MEWLTSVLIITGIWLWIVPIVLFFIILAFAENEKNTFAFIFLGVLLTILELSGIVSLFSNPFMLVGYILGYFVVGALWSVLKWYLFTSKLAVKFKKVKTAYNEKMNKKENVTPKLNINDKIPGYLMKDFKEYLVQHYFGFKPYELNFHNDLRCVVPSAHEHKKKIVTWVLWWPTSALWTLVNEPMVKLANFIYNKFQGIYGYVSRKTFERFDI